MIKTPLRILLAEDHPTDAELISYHLSQIVETLDLKIVDNLPHFNQELQSFIPDVVISDYNLPTCTGLDILKTTKDFDPNLPFIFVTGTIEDEELAANTILSGASGFILKRNMQTLQEKLRPLLKRVVFNMSERSEVREKLRNNRIAVNQIYQYLENIQFENDDQRRSLQDIKKSMDEINFGENDI